MYLLDHDFFSLKKEDHYNIMYCVSTCKHIPFGLVVRVPGFHPGGPGSIPGMGRIFWCFMSSKLCLVY